MLHDHCVLRRFTFASRCTRNRRDNSVSRLLLLCSPAYCVACVRVWYVCVCVHVCGVPHVPIIPVDTMTLKKLFTYKTKREMRSGCHEPITLTCQDLNSRLAFAEKRPPSFQRGYRAGQDSNSACCRGLSHSSPRLSPPLSLPPSLPLPVSLSFKTPSPFSPFPPSYQVFPELFFLVYDCERHVYNDTHTCPSRSRCLDATPGERLRGINCCFSFFFGRSSIPLDLTTRSFIPLPHFIRSGPPPLLFNFFTDSLSFSFLFFLSLVGLFAGE
jgi:hypothetical protein